MAGPKDAWKRSAVLRIFRKTGEFSILEFLKRGGRERKKKICSYSSDLGIYSSVKVIPSRF